MLARFLVKILVFIGLTVALAGCAAEPFVVEPPTEAKSSLKVDEAALEALGPQDYNPFDRPISLCYSTQLNTPQEVVTRAKGICPYNGKLKFFSEDALFNNCGLFQPNRVTFICTPGPPPPSPYN